MPVSPAQTVTSILAISTSETEATQAYNFEMIPFEAYNETIKETFNPHRM